MRRRRFSRSRRPSRSRRTTRGRRVLGVSRNRRRRRLGFRL